MPLLRISDLGEPDVEEAIESLSTISSLYDDFVTNERGEGHHRAAGIHASELSKCARLAVYSIMGMEKKSRLSKTWRQRFQVGHAVHAMLQRDFHNLAKSSNGTIQFEDEVPIAPHLQEVAERLNIYSHTDGVFTFRKHMLGPAYARMLLEIKTEAPDSYAKLQGPKPDHLDQVHVYMACLDVPVTYLLYFNKGNQNNTPSISPYLVRFDPARWAKLEERCELLLGYAARNELPEREEGIGCEFCPYSWTCQPRYGASKGAPRSASWKAPRRP